MGEHTDTLQLSDRFAEATVYALGKHRDQPRKGSGTPFVSHLFAVTAIVLEMDSGEEEDAIVAMLHDVIEDQGGREAEEEIRMRFGDRIAGMVRDLSDTDQDPKPEWRPRKEAYIARIATMEVGAVRVSIADKLHNARVTVIDHRVAGDALWERFNASGTETLWYYESLLEQFDARRDELGAGAITALEELRRAVAEIRAIACG